MPNVATATARSFLRLTGVDHIEFYVHDADRAATHFRSTFGMRQRAFQGPESGIQDKISYLLEQGNVRFVVTSAVRPDHPIADHVSNHGDGVHSIALAVEDVKTVFSEVKHRGAHLVQDPMEFRDDCGVVRSFSVESCGNTVITFLERDGDSGLFLPGYVPQSGDTTAQPGGFETIEQIGWAAPASAVDYWQQFFLYVMGFTPGDSGAWIETTDRTGQLILDVRETAGRARVSRIVLTGQEQPDTTQALAQGREQSGVSLLLRPSSKQPLTSRLNH